jgi:hypothetical protein
MVVCLQKAAKALEGVDITKKIIQERIKFFSKLTPQ